MMYHYNILKLLSLSSTLSFKFERMNFNLFKKKKKIIINCKNNFKNMDLYKKKYYVDQTREF